jgi:hypothetical protein
MAHTPKVSNAIQAALHDIDLLRLLVEASNKDEANAILIAYKRNRRHLGLEEPDLQEFWTSLQDGVITVTLHARDLVDLYDTLTPQLKTVKGDLQPEWVPRTE